MGSFLQLVNIMVEFNKKRESRQILQYDKATTADFLFLFLFVWENIIVEKFISYFVATLALLSLVCTL